LRKREREGVREGGTGWGRKTSPGEEHGLGTRIGGKRKDQISVGKRRRGVSPEGGKGKSERPTVGSCGGHRGVLLLLNKASSGGRL